MTASELSIQVVIKGEAIHLRGCLAKMVLRLIEKQDIILASDRGHVSLNYRGSSVEIQPAPLFKDVA